MGLSAQQWWQEWQLRVLVLGSLFVQFLLCFSAVLRKRAIPSWIRFIIWFSYVGGDALAIYALATLFDRNKHQTAGDRGMSTLELIWAPVLLIHLGGHPSITAYSLEDNMQWKQQAIIVISKVTITLYVFTKWWSGEKKLWRASFLLFVFAIAKFAQKPLALWSASYDTIVASMARSRPITETNKISCEEYVRQAKKCVQGRATVSNNQAELDIRNFPLTLYADLPASHSGRVHTMRSFLQLDEERAYKLLQKCQGDTFLVLYSKFKGIAMYRRYIALHLLLTVPVFAFLGIFAKVHKDGYKKNDVTVTYILLSCTAVLELLSLYSAPMVYALTTWHVMVSQHSLISFHHLKKSTCLMNLATFKVVQMYLYEHRYAKRINAASRLTQLVRQHVKDGWNSYIHDTASYRVFNNCRGQWTLHRKILEGDHQRRQSLEWSLNLPFDESVLLWHIATELCFHRQNTSSPQGRQGEAVQEMQSSREISNYMVYLFCVHPEMLISGARSSLLPVASDAIELIMKEIPGQLDAEDSIAQDIISPDTTNTDVKLSIKDSPARVNTTQVIAQNYIGPEVRKTETLSHDACRLANALMGLADEKHRWGLIQGVWVEMLCYSAARCKGYLHAKSLGDGGEYLSYVWLLWSFMGMEILSDKIQRPEPPGEGEIAAAGVVAPSSSRAHGDI